MVLRCIKLLRESNCSEIAQSAVVQALLTATGNRRSVEWIQRQLGLAFGLDVVSIAFLRPEIEYWLSEHVS